MDSDDDALLKSQHINTMGQFWVRLAQVGETRRGNLPRSVIDRSEEGTLLRPVNHSSYFVVITRAFLNYFLYHLNHQRDFERFLFLGVGDQKAVRNSIINQMEIGIESFPLFSSI